MSKRPMEQDFLTDDELLASLQEEQQDGGGLSKPLFEFDFQKSGPRRNWKKVVHKSTFVAVLKQLRQPTTPADVGQEITSALTSAIERRIDEDPSLAPHHRLHFNMQAEGYTHAFQSTSFTLDEFRNGSERMETYLQSLANKLNSGEKFGKNERFRVELTFICTPSLGSGHGNRLKPGRKAIETLLSRKRSIVRINNTDELCCARAIITMRAWCHKDEGVDGHRDYENVKKGLPIQEKKAKELHRQAGVEEGPCGLTELDSFQNVLSPTYQIKVLSVDSPHMIIFQGPPAHHKILLVKVDDHYHGCTSYGGFLSKSQFCHDCNRGFNEDDYTHHSCEGRRCPACHRTNCPDRDPTRRPSKNCSTCRRDFYGDDCYEYHLYRHTPEHKSVCDCFTKCLECHKIIKVKETKVKRGRPKASDKHKCGVTECRNCHQFADFKTHKCFIQPVLLRDDMPKLVTGKKLKNRLLYHMDMDDNAPTEEYPPLFVYADYEATHDEEGVQSPVLICAEREDCDEIEVFYGEDCSAEFMEYLDKQSVNKYGEERHVIVVFHNFKGYDGMFVLQQLYAEHRAVEDQICVGSKVLSLKCGPLKFIDSLCFLPFPLASFPATFGIEELKKGFFPHLFNTLDNQEYVGPIPPRDDYDPEGMSEKKLVEFDAWYTKQLEDDVEFDMKEEMVAYCTSDVKLLKAGCIKFQKEFEQHGEFNPMDKCVTIASACNRYWRKYHLRQDTIAVEPPRGWQGCKTNQSVKAFKWLAWREHHLRLTSPTNHPTADRIAHAGNGGEHAIQTPARLVHVDGYDATTRTIYEFHGCLWHGCRECFHKRNQMSRINPNRTMAELYEATKAKTALLRSMGFTVIEMWEHEWDWEVNTDLVLQDFLSTLDIVDPLEPRDAFFGGRTGAASLYAKVDESQGEEIRYVDVTSEYPWVNKYGTYPIGHPRIITNPDDQDISHYYGIAKVDVLPP